MRPEATLEGPAVGKEGNGGILDAGAGKVAERDLLAAAACLRLTDQDLSQFDRLFLADRMSLEGSAKLAQLGALAKAVHYEAIGAGQGIWGDLVLLVGIGAHRGNMHAGP